MIDLISSNGVIDPTTGQIKLFHGESESCVYISQEWAKSAAVTGTVVTIAAYYFGGALGMLSAPVSSYVTAIINDDLNCCSSDPDKVDPGKSFGFCTDKHKDLAIARLTNRVVPLGGKMKNTCYCTDQLGLQIYLPLSSDSAGVEGDCSELCNNPYLTAATTGMVNPFAVKEPQSWKKHYCVFDDILSKIIQTQGREQIRQILNGPQVADRKEVSYTSPYYGSNGWGSVIRSNGNAISFWEWDASCDNESYKDSDGYSSGSGLIGERACPNGNEVYVASCSKNNPNDCGFQPPSPFEFNEDWDVKKIEVQAEPLWEEINNYAAVSGKCFDDKTCDWNIRTWPSGVGGNIMQKTNLVWQLKFPYPSDNPGQKHSWDVFKGGAGTLEFEMLTTIAQDEDAVEPAIRVRPTGGTVWEEFVLPNPTTGPDYKITTSNGVDIFISGKCNSYFCNYNVARKIQLTLKPWYEDEDGGSKKYCLLPNPLGGCLDSTREHRRDKRHGFCDGFTLDEFSVLDLKRMDLSDYTKTLTDRAASEILKMIDDQP